MNKKKTVLITGSSSGIGQATLEEFHQRGWNVSATMRNPHLAGEEFNKDGIICPRLDVLDDASIEGAIQSTLCKFGRIDAWVNNAGYGLLGPLEGTSNEELNKQMQTNFFGVVKTIKAILPYFRGQAFGTIINVTSVGGRLAFPFTAPYHASKWAVEGLSESLRYELKSLKKFSKPADIKIKIVEPGGTKSRFIEAIKWTDHPAYKAPTEYMKNVTASLNERLPGPEIVAKAIYKAATDNSERLRYAPNGEWFFLLHSLLSDGLWRSLIEAIWQI